MLSTSWCEIEYLTRWSIRATDDGAANIRIQSGFICDDHRPEPDILWLKPRRYGKVNPTAADVLLLIEVADCSLKTDLFENADIYATAGVAEYWVVDINSARIHVMSQSDGSTYQEIELVLSPQLLCPKCNLQAKLNTQELFEVL